MKRMRAFNGKVAITIFCMVLVVVTFLSFLDASPTNQLIRRRPNEENQTTPGNGQEEEEEAPDKIVPLGATSAVLTAPNPNVPLGATGAVLTPPSPNVPLGATGAVLTPPNIIPLDPSEANLPFCETPEPDVPISAQSPPQVGDQNRQAPAPALPQPTAQNPNSSPTLPQTLPITQPSTLPSSETSTLPSLQTSTLSNIQTSTLSNTQTPTLTPTPTEIPLSQTETPTPSQSPPPPPSQLQPPPASQTGSVTLEQLSTQLNDLSKELKSMQTIGQIGQLMALFAAINRLQPVIPPGTLPGGNPEIALPRQPIPNQSTSQNPRQKLTSINPTSLESSDPPIRRRRNVVSPGITSLDI